MTAEWAIAVMLLAGSMHARSVYSRHDHSYGRTAATVAVWLFGVVSVASMRYFSLHS